MFSSFDVYEASRELQDIVGMRVDNVYQMDGEIRIKFFGRGRHDLVVGGGVYYLTSYIKPAPKVASSFSMLLRKHLKALSLLEIEQVNFDRIMAFHFGHENTEKILVAELFGEGNIILCDEKFIILGVLRREEFSSRRLASKERYVPPPTRLSPKLTWEEFEKLEIEKEKDLARLFNLGGLYAHEIFLRAGDNVKKKLFDAMNSFVKKPCIVEDMVLPYELLTHEGKEKTFFDTFIEAADEFYGKRSALEFEREGGKEKEKMVSETERILFSQKKALEEFAVKREEYSNKGDILYQNYGIVSQVLEGLKGRKDLEEIKKELGEDAFHVSSFDRKTGRVVFDFGFRVECDVRLGVNENANAYYENAKKMARKIAGAQVAIKKMLEKEKEAKKRKIEEKRVKKLRKREWYEKFRWCLSSGGRLMLGGRDARNNEMLVKKYMEPSDAYVHADVFGAAQVVLKDGQKASDEEMFEAASFACAYSKSWGRAADAFWVTPEQVTKTPPSGEYLTPGAFFISGKKNMIKNVSLKMAIGIFEDKIMFGPLDAVKTHCQTFLEIEPLDAKKEEFARLISKRLGYDDIDEIVRALPGGGRIVG